MKKVEQLKAEALAEHEAERAAALEERESKYEAGYKEFVDYRLETSRNRSIYPTSCMTLMVTEAMNWSLMVLMSFR